LNGFNQFAPKAPGSAMYQERKHRRTFATLQKMREDLASMGKLLSETNFYAIIRGSLSEFYDSYISALNATSSVLGTTLSADDLILTLTEEYECHTLKL
jgi:hypothetical protein